VPSLADSFRISDHPGAEHRDGRAVNGLNRSYSCRVETGGRAIRTASEEFLRYAQASNPASLVRRRSHEKR